MGIPAQLLISLISACAASAAILQFDLARKPLLLIVVIVIATCLTPLLSRRGGTTATASREADSSEGAREEGEVKWFNVSKGFGFIRRDNGEEIFVHFRSIQGNNKERRGLRDGQRVSYRVVNSDKGPQAEDVEALS